MQHIMTSNHNFEKQIQQSIEQFNESPSSQVWDGLDGKLANYDDWQSTGFQWTNALSIFSVAALLTIGGYFFFQNQNEPKEVPTQQKEISIAPQDELLAELFPKELDLAKKENKPLFFYLNAKGCEFCDDFIEETIFDEKVQELLNNHFVQSNVQNDQENTAALMNRFNIPSAPAVLILSSGGAMSKEILAPMSSESFLEFLNEGIAAIRKIAEQQLWQAQLAEKSDLEITRILFGEDLDLAKSNGKGLAIYVCMDYCIPCQKLQEETLPHPAVEQFLEANFDMITIDLLEEKFRPFYDKLEVKGSPAVLYFSPEGTLLGKIIGFRVAEDFLEASQAFLTNWDKSTIQSREENIDDKKYCNRIKGFFQIQHLADLQFK